MARIFRIACVVAALCAAISFYVNHSDAARGNLAELKGRAGAISERGSELAEDLGTSVKVAKKTASGVKNRLTLVREKVEASIEAGAHRVAKSQ